MRTWQVRERYNIHSFNLLFICTIARYTESFDKDEVLAISLMRKDLSELTSRQLRAVS